MNSHLTILQATIALLLLLLVMSFVVVVAIHIVLNQVKKYSSGYHWDYVSMQSHFHVKQNCSLGWCCVVVEAGCNIIKIQFQCGEFNIICDIFMQYIWVSDLHLWVLTDLLGGDQPFFGLASLKSKEGQDQPKQIHLSKRIVTINREQ